MSRLLHSASLLAVLTECLSKVPEKGNTVSIWQASLSGTFYIVFCFVLSPLRGRERLQRGGQPWRVTASAASSTSCLSSISSSS